MPVGGTTAEGVKILAINGNSVTLEVEGKQQVLRVGAVAPQEAVSSENKTVSSEKKIFLHPDHYGFYHVNGTINGKNIRFLVDTGAWITVLGASDARRLGISVAQASRIKISGGVGKPDLGWRVKLPAVEIDGGIVLHDLDALVGRNDRQNALLGMSFLKHMQIEIDAGVMVLKEKSGSAAGEEMKKVAIKEKTAPSGVAYMTQDRYGLLMTEGTIRTYP